MSAPWNKGIKTGPLSRKTREKMSILRKGMNTWSKGRECSQEHRKKVSVSLIGNKRALGRKPWNYIEDRTLVNRQIERNNPEYKQWRKQVWLRDNFKCKIANPDCEGKIEAHHILGWSSHPELRYQLNNGITLCHAHHPRKRSEEAKLSPYFQNLVAEMN